MYEGHYVRLTKDEHDALTAEVENLRAEVLTLTRERDAALSVR